MVAYGEKRRGDTDWCSFDVIITRPNHNEIRACLFYMQRTNTHGWKRTFYWSGGSVTDARGQATISEALERLYKDVQDPQLFMPMV